MLKNLFNTIIWRIINTIVALILSIILARELGAEQRGNYALFTIAMTMFSLIINFGLPEAIVYFVGQNPDQKNSFFSVALVFTLFSFIILSSSLHVYSNFSNSIIGLDISQHFTKISIGLFFIPLNTLARHLILGENRIKLFNVLSSLDSIFLILLVVFSYLFSNVNYNNVTNFYIYSTSISFVIHYSAIYLLKYQLQLNKINRAIFLNTIKPGLNFFIIGIGGFLTGRLNTIFLQEFHTSKSVGLYTVAIAIPNIIAMIPAQIAVVLYPRISNCKDRPTAIAFGIKILRLSFVMLIILVSFFILISDLIINYFYGNEYTTTYFAVKILVLSSLFTGINSIIINILAGMGNSKYGLYNTIVIIISLSLLSFLTYLYNFEGAALSSLLANIISTIVLVKAFLRFCNKNIKDLIINKSDFRDTLTNFHDILFKK